jgi:hypothetical protein
VHVANAAQQSLHRLLHIGVQVHGVQHLHIGVFLGNAGQGLADALEAAAKVFAAVAGDQDEALAGCPGRQTSQRTVAAMLALAC